MGPQGTGYSTSLFPRKGGADQEERPYYRGSFGTETFIQYHDEPPIDILIPPSTPCKNKAVMTCRFLTYKEERLSTGRTVQVANTHSPLTRNLCVKDTRYVPPRDFP
jgi:hypothetical protein